MVSADDNVGSLHTVAGDYYLGAAREQSLLSPGTTRRSD